RENGPQRFLRGTFFPFFRALESAMAIACLRLFTLPPLPPRPLLARPRLYRCISRLTSSPEPREYFLLRLRFLAIRVLLCRNEDGRLAFTGHATKIET